MPTWSAGTTWILGRGEAGRDLSLPTASLLTLSLPITSLPTLSLPVTSLPMVGEPGREEVWSSSAPRARARAWGRGRDVAWGNLLPRAGEQEGEAEL